MSQDLESRTIGELLRPYAAELRSAARLPSPESLLWRARLRDRLARAETAQRLLSLYDRVALAVGAAAAVLAVTWNWDAIVGLLPDFGAGAATSGSPPSSLFIAGGVLALAALAVWMMTVWAEE